MSGCRSRFIATAISNETDAPIRIVELDYPGASFGASAIAAHATYSYRFKLLGSGPISVSWNEAGGTAHLVAGPELREGQEGSLVVHIGPKGAVRWEQTLSPR